MVLATLAREQKQVQQVQLYDILNYAVHPFVEKYIIKKFADVKDKLIYGKIFSIIIILQVRKIPIELQAVLEHNRSTAKSFRPTKFYMAFLWGSLN